MTIAWFICQYKQKTGSGGRLIRYCAMDDFNPLIIDQDKGGWADTEVLGSYSIAKVAATDETLAKIADTAGFQRIPRATKLDQLLSTLTLAQRKAIRNIVLNMGYTGADIDSALPDLANVTLGQVLRFMAQRRLKARWDDVAGQIVMDGDYQTCKPIESVDDEVEDVVSVKNG
jgi:hypothetical protein